MYVYLPSRLRRRSTEIHDECETAWTFQTTNLSGEGFKQPGLDGKSLHAPQSQYQSYHQLQAHNNEPQSQMQSQVQQLHPSSLPPLQPLNILFFNELNWVSYVFIRLVSAPVVIYPKSLPFGTRSYVVFITSSPLLLLISTTENPNSS